MFIYIYKSLLFADVPVCDNSLLLMDIFGEITVNMNQDPDLFQHVAHEKSYSNFLLFAESRGVNQNSIQL